MATRSGSRGPGPSPLADNGVPGGAEVDGTRGENFAVAVRQRDRPAAIVEVREAQYVVPRSTPMIAIIVLGVMSISWNCISFPKEFHAVERNSDKVKRSVCPSFVILIPCFTLTGRPSPRWKGVHPRPDAAARGEAGAFTFAVARPSGSPRPSSRGRRCYGTSRSCSPTGEPQPVCWSRSNSSAATPGGGRVASGSPTGDGDD